MVGLTISHPFDTLKTHFQDGLKPPRSIKALYRGLLPPLLGVSIEKSIVFGTFNSIKYPLLKSGYSKDQSCFISGALAGLSASFIVTPAERLKILLQTEQKIPKLTTLYKGFSATLTREMPGFAIYFTVYENLYNTNMSLISSFWCGSLAGSCAWLFIYPQDLIKTQMQSASGKQSYASYINSNIENEGYLGFIGDSIMNLRRQPHLHWWHILYI